MARVRRQIADERGCSDGDEEEESRRHQQQQKY
jgi:hypothetical protein